MARHVQRTGGLDISNTYRHRGLSIDPNGAARGMSVVSSARSFAAVPTVPNIPLRSVAVQSPSAQALMVRNMIEEQNRITHSVPPPSTHPSVIKSLHRDELHAISILILNEGACSICVEDFAIAEMTTTLPCSHAFHSSCTEQWLTKQNTCPICRFELESVHQHDKG